MSVFSTLSLLGILGKYGSEMKIFEDLVDVFLKEYYQETAYKLLELDKNETIKK